MDTCLVLQRPESQPRRRTSPDPPKLTWQRLTASEADNVGLREHLETTCDQSHWKEIWLALSS